MVLPRQADASPSPAPKGDSYLRIASLADVSLEASKAAASPLTGDEAFDHLE